MYFYKLTDYPYVKNNVGTCNDNVIYDRPRVFNNTQIQRYTKLIAEYRYTSETYIIYTEANKNGTNYTNNIYYDQYSTRPVYNYYLQCEKPLGSIFTFYTELVSEDIKGIRLFKKNNFTPPTSYLSLSYNKLDFYYNSNKYIGIYISHASETNPYAYYNSFHDDKNGVLKKSALSIWFVKENCEYEKIWSLTEGWVSEEDVKIDIGSSVQKVCTEFYTWIMSNTTADRTARVNVYDGIERICTAKNLIPYEQLTLTTMGGITKVTTNNNESFQFTTPKNFKGLSLSPLALVNNIPDGKTTAIYNNSKADYYCCTQQPKPIPDSFTIQMFTCSAELNRVDKTNYLENGQSFNITLKDEANILSMSINLDLTNIDLPDNWAIPYWNYCYIPNFSRYYYVEPTSLYNNIWKFDLTVDVLMSYKDYIGALGGIVDRVEDSQNKGFANKKYKDDLIISECYPEITVTELSPLSDFIPTNKSVGLIPDRFLINFRGGTLE